MAVKSGFFMSVNGDRRYDASFFAEYFSSFIGNGVFPNPSNNLQVVEGTNMQTVVKAGKAWINGYYLHNDSDLVLQHGVAHGTMKRIDRIVVRWNVLTRQMVIEILKGTNATSPVAPAITRDTNYYDLVLADVYINAGTIRITQANITDQRLNSALCGVVTQTVKTVDTTTLFNQYQSWINQQKANYEAELATWTAAQKDGFANWRNTQQTAFTNWMTAEQAEFDDWSSAQQTVFTNWTATQKGDFESWRNTQQTAFTNWMAAEKSEFDAWFENLQDVLNGDVVANLQSQIDQHKMDDARHNSYGTSSTAASTAAKVVTRSGFILATGAHVDVKFTNANTATSPTLNVNNTGAKPIYQNGTAGAAWSVGEVVEFIYDGTNWCASPTVQNASTSRMGITQLNDNTNSTSTTQAATANAVRKVNDALAAHLADDALIKHKASQVSIEDASNLFATQNVEGALKELFINVSNGKMQVATAITDKGVAASGDDTFEQLADKVSQISTKEHIFPIKGVQLYSDDDYLYTADTSSVMRKYDLKTGAIIFETQGSSGNRGIMGFDDENFFEGNFASSALTLNFRKMSDKSIVWTKTFQGSTDMAGDRIAYNPNEKMFYYFQHLYGTFYRKLDARNGTVVAEVDCSELNLSNSSTRYVVANKDKLILVSYDSVGWTLATSSWYNRNILAILSKPSGTRTEFTMDRASLAVHGQIHIGE